MALVVNHLIFNACSWHALSYAKYTVSHWVCGKCLKTLNSHISKQMNIWSASLLLQARLPSPVFLKELTEIPGAKRTRLDPWCDQKCYFSKIWLKRKVVQWKSFSLLGCKMGVDDSRCEFKISAVLAQISNKIGFFPLVFTFLGLSWKTQKHWC